MPKPEYEVLIERSAEKDLRRLPEEVHDRVIGSILTLALNPRPTGAKKLVGSKSDWRIRVGDYRVLYDIADQVPQEFRQQLQSRMHAEQAHPMTMSAEVYAKP